jgi:hypothetical protein
MLAILQEFFEQPFQGGDHSESRMPPNAVSFGHQRVNANVEICQHLRPRILIRRLKDHLG